MHSQNFLNISRLHFATNWNGNFDNLLGQSSKSNTQSNPLLNISSTQNIEMVN